MELARNTRSQPNRGAITLIEASIYIVIALVVLAVAVTQGGGLFNRNDASTEYNNAAEIMTNARSMLKNAGSYEYNSAAEMTGALILAGGAPANMKVVGTKSSGTATLQNVWGGAVTLQPVSSGGGQKSAFSLAYNAVPQEACLTLATKLSASPGVASTQINGTTTTGAVATALAGAQCTADQGSVGQNIITWTSNT
jgi:hypothetical protein